MVSKQYSAYIYTVTNMALRQSNCGVTDVLISKTMKPHPIYGPDCPSVD